MKLLYTISFSVLLSVSAAGQKTTKAGPKDKAVIEHFKNEYKRKNYKKFTGQITVKDKQIVFDNKTVFYDPADKITALLLKEGLVYPQLLTDFQVDKFELKTVTVPRSVLPGFRKTGKMLSTSTTSG